MSWQRGAIALSAAAECADFRLGQLRSINALAGQNAQLLKAINVLRVRTRFLINAYGALVIAQLAMGTWVAFV